MLTSSVWTTPHPRLNMIRCVWVALMLLSDKRGFVHASVPGLAAAAVVSVEDVEEALELFRSPDRYSRTKEHEGRRLIDVDGGWFLLNYAGHRAASSEELSKQSKRAWYRRKKAAEVAAAPTATPSDTPAEASETDAVRLPNLDFTHQRSSKLDSDFQSFPLPPSLPPSYSPLLFPQPPSSRISAAVLDPNFRSLAGPDQRGSTAGVDPGVGHVELEGQRVVYRSLSGWEPKPEHLARAVEIGLPRDVFDAKLDELRNGPIGGQRGVFDLDKYVMRLLPQWRTWHQTANYSAVHPPGSTNGARGGPGRGPPWRPILEPTSKHRAFAKEHGLDLATFVRDIQAGTLIDDLGLKRATEMLGERMSLALRAKREAAGKP